MKKAFSLLTIVFLFIIQVVYSQQDPQFSQNMFNHMAVNPGSAGSNDAICASALIREQWMGFEGNPSTKVFNINSPILQDVFPSGVGFTIITDNIGFEKNLGINFAYAYRLSLGPGKLGLGLNLGFFNKALVNTDWQLGDPNQPITGDPLIPNDESAMAIDLGFGGFYRTDKFYAGISATHLNQPTLELSQQASVFLKTHYYFTSGYNLQLPNPLFELVPSVFIQYDGTTSQMCFNTNLVYNKKFWGGISYRPQDSYIAILGMEFINGIKFGIAYDFLTSDIGTYSSGSFEAMIAYCFNISVDKTKSKNNWIRNF